MDLRIDQQWKDVEEDQDIYGDLESSIFTSSRPVTKNPDDAVQIEKLLKDNSELKLQLQRLKRENNALLRNVSSLHVTAKHEIEKKNFLISELQKKLKDMVLTKVRTNKLTKLEADEVLRTCEMAYVESHSKVTLEEIKRAINENKDIKNEVCRTKSFKFGNMSWYFVNHQNPCRRNEHVEFPIGKSDKKPADCSTSQSNIPPSQLSVNSKEETSQSQKHDDDSKLNSNYSNNKTDTIKSIDGGSRKTATPRESPERRPPEGIGRTSTSTNKHSSAGSTNKPEYHSSKSKDKNGLGTDGSSKTRRSPRHLKTKSKSRNSSRDEELFGPSRHSKSRSKERSFSRSENIYKKHYERKRSRERSKDSRSSDSSHPHSERLSRTNSTRSSKRHRRDIS